MNALKAIGMVAALVLIGACGSGDSGDPLPSEVSSIISANCGNCHGSPTANSAPMPITNCNDVLAAAPTNSSVTVADAMKTRINDAENPMPPTGQLESGPLADLNQWLDDGTPGCE